MQRLRGRCLRATQRLQHGLWQPRRHLTTTELIQRAQGGNFLHVRTRAGRDDDALIGGKPGEVLRKIFGFIRQAAHAHQPTL